jgi:hypothetical protein
VSKPTGTWATGDSYRFYLRCPKEKAKAERQVTWNESDQTKETRKNSELATLGRFKFYGTFPDLPFTLPSRAVLVANADAKERQTFVRCDNASYLSKGTGGCVFGDVVSSLQHELGQGYDAAYKHFWTACYAPNETYLELFKPATARFPAIKEKKIPGCLDDNQNMKYNYLHRIDKDTAENNRKALTNPKCAWVWGSATGGSSGNECDEYPFASTWERWNNKYPGAIVTNAGFSLCPINGAENGRAGTLLGSTFYSKERLLVGDPFFIRFKTPLDSPAKCIPAIPGRTS